MAEKAAKEALKRTFEQMIPEEFHKYKIIFDKEAFERLPKLGARGPWDHTIDLVEGAKTKNCKVYPLTVEEQT